MVAAVTAQAPPSSWRFSSWGDIVVFPCGARRKSWSRQYFAMSSMLCRKAESLRTITGSMNSPPSTFQPRARTERIGTDGPAGKDL